MPIPVRPDTQPVITAGAYSAGDAVGGLLTFDLKEAAGNGRTSGWITGVRVIDDADQGINIELVLFHQTFTAIADNSAFDPSDGDLQNCLGSILADTHRSFNDNGVSQDPGIMHPWFTIDGRIYGQLVTRGTPTYAAIDDLTVEILVMFDR